MVKNAYYFPHDSNAKDDPKCVLLIEQLGLEGYGIYWILIETLRDQPDYRYPLVLIPALARKYNTTTEKVKTVINGYGLFTVDNDNFFSESLIRRMEPFDHKREMARIAGKRSAQVRLLNIGSTSVEQPLNDGSTHLQPEEKRREEYIREEKKREDGETSAAFSKDKFSHIISLYEQNIGMPTGIIADKIKFTLQEYSFEWIVSAIEKAATSEKRSWGYVEGILKGWKRDGFNNGNGNGHNGHKPTEKPTPRYKYVN